MLKAAQADFSRWPLAAQCLDEKLRAEALRLKPSPPFLSEVFVRKRFWRSKELEPTQEKVLYLGPSWIDHGHWIEREDGSKALTRIVISNWVEPPSDQHWIALEDDMNPVEQRRRLREKTAVKAFELMAEGEGEEELKEREDQQRIQRVIEEEMTTAVFDHHEVLEEVLGGVAWLKEATVEEKDPEILQTKIVSQAEVRKNAQEWVPAIKTEMDSLFHGKQALRVVPELLKEDLAELIPPKMVSTLKPQAGLTQGKKKARIVACGNYIEDQPAQELYAGGAGAIALRLALALAAQRSWVGESLDIRTAFLNAPMEVSRDEEKIQKRALLKPPALLQELGLIKRGEMWEAWLSTGTARELWGHFRDEEMMKMEAVCGAEKVRMVQMLTEPNLWRIVEGEGSKEVLKGVVVVYVDDMLFLGEGLYVDLMIEEVRRKWETSVPEQLGEETGVRFLGAELWRTKNGSIQATQSSYITDLLRTAIQPSRERLRTVADGCGRLRTVANGCERLRTVANGC